MSEFMTAITLVETLKETARLRRMQGGFPKAASLILADLEPELDATLNRLLKAERNAARPTEPEPY